MEKYAVISDTHGNIEALKSAILDAKENKCNAFIFLGDYGTDFLQAHECLELIRNLKKEYPTFVIKGNREEYIKDYLEGKNPSWESEETRKAIVLTCKSLTQEDIQDIYNMPESLIINSPIGSKPLFLKHALPLTENEKNIIKQKNIDTILFGHSHSSGKWKSDGLNIFNPGSCGLTDDAIMGATYGILEYKEKEWDFEVKKVEYDISKQSSYIDENQEFQINSAHWPDLLKKSMICGKQLTVYYIVELQRLMYLYKEAIENENSFNSKFADTLKINIFMQLKNVSVDINGNYLPVVDLRYRELLGDRKMDVMDSMTFPLTKVNKTFTKVPQEIYDKAYENTMIYCKQELLKQQSFEETFSSIKPFSL